MEEPTDEEVAAFLKSREEITVSEKRRTPKRFNEIVLQMFESERNTTYLKGLFARRIVDPHARAFLISRMDERLMEYRPIALEVLSSDAIAQRGQRQSGSDYWEEVRRLNRNFLKSSMTMVKDLHHLVTGDHGETYFQDNQYHYTMFENDSLRPPGLEMLNDPAPLYDIGEDRAQWSDDGDTDMFGVSTAGISSLGWPNVPADENQAGNKSALAMARQAHTYSSAPLKTKAPYNSGSKYMRWNGQIPVFHRGGREGYDRDDFSNNDLRGTEFDCHVRAWDIEEMTVPRSERKYRNF
jgi:hypothetical protein